MSSSDGLVKRLKFLVDSAAAIAPLGNATSPNGRKLFVDLASDLSALRELWLADDEILKQGRERIAAKAMEQAEAGKKAMAEKGPHLWKYLHKRALKPVSDVLAEDAWLKGHFRSMVGCSICQRNFDRHLTELPPRFHDYFAWTVDLHNLVNKELGKPAMSVEDARKLWASESAE